MCGSRRYDELAGGGVFEGFELREGVCAKLSANALVVQGALVVIALGKHGLYLTAVACPFLVRPAGWVMGFAVEGVVLPG